MERDRSGAEDRRCLAQELPSRRCEARGVYLDRYWRGGWVCREHMPEYTVSTRMVELMGEDRLDALE